MQINLPDLTPPAELDTIASMTPTARAKEGLELRLEELKASHKSNVNSAIVELRSNMASELNIVCQHLKWGAPDFIRLETELDEIDERAGIWDVDQLKSWELSDKVIIEQEVLKARVGRLWNKAELFVSNFDAWYGALASWIKRSNYYEKDWEAASDVDFLLSREKLLMAQAESYKKHCQRTYQRIEGTIITIQSLSGRKFQATRYLMDTPRVEQNEYEVLAKNSL